MHLGLNLIYLRIADVVSFIYSGATRSGNNYIIMAHNVSFP